MKKARILSLIMLVGAALAVASCSKEKEAEVSPTVISSEVKAQIKALGFSAKNAHKVARGIGINAPGPAQIQKHIGEVLGERDLLMSVGVACVHQNKPRLWIAAQKARQ